MPEIRELSHLVWLLSEACMTWCKTVHQFHLDSLGFTQESVITTSPGASVTFLLPLRFLCEESGGFLEMETERKRLENDEKQKHQDAK